MKNLIFFTFINKNHNQLIKVNAVILFARTMHLFYHRGEKNKIELLVFSQKYRNNS